LFRLDIKHLAEICAALGVRRAVIAPGSRNTPLTLALTAQPEIACFPVTDERSAGFFALGMAQYSREPVVLVCTSGSAVLNFAPAVVEAYYQHLPLIVITADRPVQWIDQSDGQTIRQQNIFANYIKASFQLPSELAPGAVSASGAGAISGLDAGTVSASGTNTASGVSSFSNRLVAQAVDTALQFPRGPVHINVPLNEPLYVEMPENTPPSRVLRSLPTEIFPSAETAIAFANSWQKASKRMIVVGTGNPDESLTQLLNALAETTETLVVAENLSNISGPAIVSTPDLFFSSLSEDEKSALKPDLLVTIGHSVVSKQLKTYLRTYQPAEHWQLQTELPYADTYRALTHIVPVKGMRLLEKVLDDSIAHLPTVALVDLHPEVDSSDKKQVEPLSVESQQYRSLIFAVSKRAGTRAAAYINHLPLSDIAVFRDLLPLIPPGWVVQLANSTPVRISQFFETRADLVYFCNRGTSGIEGSVATAAGSAVASGLPTLLISGDLSFLYDSNGLWNSNFPPNLKIVVLNNEGANIFSMIGDQKVIERCQPFFDASHSVNLEALCKAYGIKYRRYAENQMVSESDDSGFNRFTVNNLLTDTTGNGDFNRVLTDFLELPGAAVLEISTERVINVTSYKQLFKTLQ
jgi:2-succinyl-5-enolpyruvyl-6-hydroxy-3-cyclohexene-1-carboxylate synthase